MFPTDLYRDQLFLNPILAGGHIFLPKNNSAPPTSFRSQIQKKSMQKQKNKIINSALSFKLNKKDTFVA